ncbi:GDSL/SGNH-like acyl-esterase family found in Pmr5 and Cas1p-domain-containing protein [Cokeromyces recurvatus]|uniref:GDSL/SGNH-like acyl-esterase family found in Pmr5 and Cas1p-domain-containing protein n=1 Tax=Cokeromyces recurvatus TaxID=90255 RepID=UPI002220FF5F|nr:GDSL/SGNH-like acyl-esterase family found in Pmr5 and Cas1p-domain-containing protein [Cokeromyces recurvatus]KAI7905932.1 GDSL/SGNH-like acyl-esterase family found in Pmr5 and Cas1p-domain-containing protein [Cokeromyces recurvatus]
MVWLSSSNREEASRQMRYIYIVAALTVFILWITTYQHSMTAFISSNNKQQQTNTTLTTQPLCTIETFNKGKWAYSPIQLEEPFTAKEFAKITGYYCMKKFAHRCFRRGGNELTRSKTIADYRWLPESCKLLKFDAGKLAKHFVQYPILFVGDSITQLQFESLSCLLGHEFPNKHPNQSTLNGGNSKIRVDERAPINGHTAAMAYIRSDYLIRLNDYKMISPLEPVGLQLGREENHPWVHALSQFNYIVINTGPHWHPNVHWGSNQSETELLMAFKKAMHIIFDYLKIHIKLQQKVWIRTTPYGHANCSQFKEPQQNPLVPSGQQGEYEWHLFQKFDLIWKELLDEVNDTRFSLFDITTMFNQRGDAHSKPDKDCLHTCIPGPVDDWNRLLYHEIMKYQKE